MRSAGDRAVILAPQGLDYIAAFLGAMQAGLIAVPLSVPQVGSHDERVECGAARHVTLCHSHDVRCRGKSSLSTSVSRTRTPRSIGHRGRFAGPGLPERIQCSATMMRRASRICSTRPGRPAVRPGS